MGDPVILAERWAERVGENRRQVEGVRRGPERDDFYAPVSAHFVADPHRRDDPVLDALLDLVRPGETWLDIGAGAGRFALPIALAAGEVIALEPSAGMAAALRDAVTQHGIHNVRVIEAHWPIPAPASLPPADVALIAHVGYDVEAISPFLDAMEASAGRLCVAVLLEHSPASLADALWPAVHGLERVPLPALGELLELLAARGAAPVVRYLPRPPRAFDDLDELLGYLRRQLWIEDGDEEADRRLRAELARRLPPTGDLVLDAGADRLGLVTWVPPAGRDGPADREAGPEDR